MKVDENEFRCKVCGGQLTVEDPELGIVKCINCTNRSRMDGDLTNLMRIKQIYRPQQIMQNMTDNQVEKLEKERRRRNVVYTFKALIALLALIVAGLFITIMVNLYTGKLTLGNAETIIIAIIGIGLPSFMSVFSKVYKGRNGSIFVHVVMFFVFLIITLSVLYLTLTRYFSIMPFV